MVSAIGCHIDFLGLRGNQQTSETVRGWCLSKVGAQRLEEGIPIDPKEREG